MDRFRAAIDELVDKVKEAINGEPKSPVEILLDQHLSLEEDFVSFSPKNCTAIAIPTAAMNDFAARTRNVVDYPFIMERVWEILVDHQHDPTRMKKALNLLLYLLINGAIQVLKDCQESIRLTFIQSLTEDYNRYEFEQYKFSQHLDVGAGVRKTAAEILHLLTNERELFHARRQAEKLHQKLSDRGLRCASSSSSVSMTTGTSSAYDVRPPRYTDSYSSKSEDLGMKIVTHPDELFESVTNLPVGSEMVPNSHRIYGNLAPKQDTANCNGQSATRGQNRKNANNAVGRVGGGGDNVSENVSSRLTATESVDLLGLEALGLESLTSATARRDSTSLPRTQSARLPTPQEFSSII